jgi:hypothetical protein
VRKFWLGNHITTPHSRPTVTVWLLLGGALAIFSLRTEKSLNLLKMPLVKDDRKINKCTSEWNRDASQDAFSLNKQSPFGFLETVLYVSLRAFRRNVLPPHLRWLNQVHVGYGPSSVTLKMEAVCSYRTSVQTKHSARCKSLRTTPPWNPENIYQVCSF